MHAALVFRVGVADETAATRGVTHLVEHLAMPVGVFRHMPAACNAVVDMTRTTFFADGEPHDVTAFLAGVIERLANLPLDERFDVERQILLAEAETNDAAAVDHLAMIRYGLDGYGLVGVAEHGLHRLRRDEVRAWAAERFGRQNAVILCTGPPPDLPVRLAEGRRWPMPICPERGRPRTKTGGPGGGATVTFTGPPTAAFQVARRILADRAEQVLRHQRGLSYTASGDSTRLADSIHATIHGACRDADGSALLGELLAIIDDVAENGPTAAELEADRTSNARDLTTRDPTMRVAYSALSELYGIEPVMLADLLADEARVTADDVAAAVAAARATLLIAAGDDVPLPEGFRAHTRAGVVRARRSALPGTTVAPTRPGHPR
jgi:zinc protease